MFVYDTRFPTIKGNSFDEKDYFYRELFRLIRSAKSINLMIFEWNWNDQGGVLSATELLQERLPV